MRILRVTGCMCACVYGFCVKAGALPTGVSAFTVVCFPPACLCFRVCLFSKPIRQAGRQADNEELFIYFGFSRFGE